LRTIRLTLAYDGSDFAGWQVQPGRRTVQASLESVLSRLLDRPVQVAGSGRTDAGVHAAAQVASFRTNASLDTERMRRGLNALLPPDVRVIEAAEAPEAFHARRSAVSKEYRYRVARGDVVSPFRRRYVWHRWGHLDLVAMDEAAACLVGSHDFSSLVAAGGQAEHHRRKVSRARWSVEGPDLWEFRIEADGFLYRMVRNIVGTLVEVGRGRRSPQEMPMLIAARDRRRAGPTAPAQGLRLERVIYRPEALGAPTPAATPES
jgi:tRNA pseudouridine38-40 synthase